MHSLDIWFFKIPVKNILLFGVITICKPSFWDQNLKRKKRKKFWEYNCFRSLHLTYLIQCFIRRFIFSFDGGFVGVPSYTTSALGWVPVQVLRRNGILIRSIFIQVNKIAGIPFLWCTSEAFGVFFLFLRMILLLTFKDCREMDPNPSH